VIQRRSLTAALLAVALLDACGGETPRARDAPGGRAEAPTVARRRLDDRPPLVLVQRDGDPAPALAFAAAHDFGSVASVAMVAALKARLAARGFNVRGRPSSLGFAVTLFVTTPNEARRFVQILPSVLDEPFGAADPALGVVHAAVQALAAQHLAGAAEEAPASCTGELFSHDGTRPFDPASETGRRELGAWLKSTHAVKAGALAAVGPSEIVAAMEDALARGAAWPDGAPAVDTWPIRDELGVDFAANATHRLSLALRLGSEDAAARSADALARSQGALARRLSALRPEWQIDRVVAVGRPRGACLRLDATPLAGELGPAASDVAKALSVMSDEAHEAVQATSPRGVDDAIIGTTDAADAAAAAAWRALVGREQPGPERRFVAYGAGSADKGRFDLPAAIAAWRETTAQSLIEVARRGEPGQGRLWALLAPVCGTSAESASDAGEGALVVSALARAAPSGDVSIEPWIATDGVGLLAGTRRLGPDETTDAQARRLGRALGELIATTRPSPTELVGARDDLAAGVGGEQHRGFAVALDALTQGHPSWLEPRGTFAALGSAPSGGFEAAVLRWLARPLRVAVLTNGDSSQADLVRAEAERWLRPVRGEVLRCPPHARAVPTASELTLSVAGDAPEGSYVAFPFPTYEHRLPTEARAVLFLLNRSGGLLDQALAGLSASATALALGGPDAAALIVEVVTAEGQRQAAVDRIRALFDGLVSAKLAPPDVEDARRELERQDSAEAVDPRRRVVGTWRGTPRPAEPPLDAARLAKWLATLRRSATVLVNVAPRG
jgi:hypothetical protein